MKLDEFPPYYIHSTPSSEGPRLLRKLNPGLLGNFSRLRK